MKNKVLLLLFCPLLFSSQVGINTTAPQGAFHIDGAKDNASTSTATQQLNDFVVKTDGKVGIGTANPIDLLSIAGQGNAGSLEIKFNILIRKFIKQANLRIIKIWLYFCMQILMFF